MVKPNPAGYAYVFDGPRHNYSLKEHDGTQKPELQFFTNSGDVTQVVADTALPLDRWSHVAVTYDQSEAIIYIDGAEDTTDTTASGPIDQYSEGNYWLDTGESRIGRYLSSNRFGAYHYDGKLDEVRVYNRALSKTEIQDLAEMDEE